MKFPKATDSHMKGMSGEEYFKRFVLDEMKCIPNKIDADKDYGLDFFVELRQDGFAIGKKVAVQVKHGDSYFRQRTLGGYKYKGKMEHLNYYANCNIPVFFVILDDEFEKMKFVQFKLEKTMSAEDGKWWIEIPDGNDLRRYFKDEVFKAVGAAIDYEELMEKDWLVSGLLQSSGNIFFAITKAEVENEDFSYILNYMHSISRNKQMLMEAKNSLEIFFPEYADEFRELYEIPEVVRWLKKSINIGIPWFFLLSYKLSCTGLMLLMEACCCIDVQCIEKDRHELVISNEKVQEFLEIGLCTLNEFAEENGIEENIILEISDRIVECYTQRLIDR